VIADDNLLVRQGITSLLREAGIEVAAQADSAEGLLPEVDAHTPDVAQDALRRRVQDQSRDRTDPTLVCREQLGRGGLPADAGSRLRTCAYAFALPGS